MIPVAIQVTGDIQVGRGYIGYAKTQLGKLKRSMSFQKLNEGYSGELKPYPGVVVECWSTFNLTRIAIHVDTPGKERNPAIDAKRKRCLEFPCFALGYIVKEGTAEDGSPLDMLSPERRYDVELCTYGMYYMIERCNTSDFATYDIGEQVLVSTWWNQGPCCTNEPIEQFRGFVVVPVICNHPRWTDD